MPPIEAPLGTFWQIRTDFYPYPTIFMWEALGQVPYYLDIGDRRSAVLQFRDAPMGFDVMKGFTLVDGLALKYPGDPLMYPIATCEFRDELILVYPSDWVCVRHADRTIDVARMD